MYRRRNSLIVIRAGQLPICQDRLFSHFLGGRAGGVVKDYDFTLKR